MTREEHIQQVIADNANSEYSFMRTRGYAEAYVDGMRQIEDAQKMWSYPPTTKPVYSYRRGKPWVVFQ